MIRLVISADSVKTREVRYLAISYQLPLGVQIALLKSRFGAINNERLVLRDLLLSDTLLKDVCSQTFSNVPDCTRRPVEEGPTSTTSTTSATASTTS